MKAIRLILCALCCLILNPVFGQNEGTLRQQSNPAFNRAYENYLKANERRTLEGYRVQVFNGSGQAANRFKSEVIRSLPDMEVMVVFETPDYKIQIGNYRSPFEAEAALNKIRESFPGAFVVRTSIDPPTLKKAEKNVESDPNRLNEEEVHELAPEHQEEE